MAEEERKRKLITEIAINWEASREESERKHKALALLIEAKEEEKIMKQELAQKRWGKKELEMKGGLEGVVEGGGEKEENTWKQRWFQDYKTKQVYTSSKILSKTKQKMKQLEKNKVRELEEAEVAEEERKDAETEPQGIIGSIQEYASLVGKSVKQLAEAKYDLPEVSDSESEDSGGEEDGNLWGTILGGGD